ncbi:glutamate 5-kinase [bacterium C-53]|nr:glutamate 5-kinase [Lachnospiraceae bacterium]NBI01920.1 glutamate 5-kinase [Lachnospiraceae bacterium]RKJ12321.1 glutamate 5-kinase [bacterium C-53]
MNHREKLKAKKRVVIKIGSSSLTHPETGGQDLIKLEKLVRELTDLKNRGMDVTLVSSGAIAVGKKAVHISGSTKSLTEEGIAVKQACAAIGQARLMMTYQKLFAEYNQITAQILMTKKTVLDPLSRRNTHNTFTELFKLGVIPVVNENDTVATYEIDNLGVFGDNDTLSAIVTALVDADLLILLSDIDGLYTDDPRDNPDARFIPQVDELTDDLFHMGKSTTGSSVGTGGMSTKLNAAKIATSAGADMVIANGHDVEVIHRIIDGEEIGTLFSAHRDENFYMADYLSD